MKPKSRVPQRDLFGAHLSELLNPEHPLYVLAERLEKLLEATIHTALAMKAIKPRELEKVNVDTTVQEKAVAFPTDARLYQKMRVALIREAKQLNIPLRQSYRFVGKKLLFRQGRYAHALHGNPYDGHTLEGAILQIERLTKRTPNDVIVDQGYRGHGYQGSAMVHVVRTIPKKATRAVRQMLKRRASVEPTIGHLKSDNRLSRNHLTGKTGDQINTLLAAAGYNLRKLLRWIVFSPVLALFEWLKAMLNFKSPVKRHLLRP